MFAPSQKHHLEQLSTFKNTLTGVKNARGEIVTSQWRSEIRKKNALKKVGKTN